jgi:hypothetical protein
MAKDNPLIIRFSFPAAFGLLPKDGDALAFIAGEE